MSFDWWHPECSATCFLMVTIVEVLSLILDLCCLNEINFIYFFKCLKHLLLRISLIMLKIPDLILYRQRTSVVDKTQPTQKSRSNDGKTNNTRWSYSLLACLTAVSQLQQSTKLFKNLRVKSPTKANTDHRNGNQNVDYAPSVILIVNIRCLQ